MQAGNEFLRQSGGPYAVALWTGHRGLKPTLRSGTFMTQPLIRARELTKSFIGNTGKVLDGLELEVMPGESLAIVGPSGAGKSTLLHMLNGLERPDSGYLELFGRATAPLSEKNWSAWRRDKIATVFQDSNLIPTLSLERNIAFRANLARRRDAERRRHLLRVLGIGDVASRYPDQVSGGQRQRGAIAAAFAMVPALVLADEPTGNLDEHTAQQVAALFFEGIRERGLTAVIVTHNDNLARQCDRVLELSGGILRPAGNRSRALV